MSSIRDYVPLIYRDIKEFDTLIDVEGILFDEVEQKIEKIKNNQYVVTADAEGISMRERILRITPAATDTLEFRRARVINRLSTAPPFTFNLLKQRLDAIIGKNKWKAYIDYDNYTLYVESSVDSQVWFNELLLTVVNLKPVNMVFIGIPLISQGIKVSEGISYSQKEHNYILGKWRLSYIPFANIYDRGTIKVPEVSSLTNSYISHLTQSTMEKVNSVLLNDSIQITELTKEVEDNTTIIKYAVERGAAETITNIKLLDNNDEVLASSDVYIPLTSDVIIKHAILIKEGV